jgi:hypothetical protein
MERFIAKLPSISTTSKSFKKYYFFIEFTATCPKTQKAVLALLVL